MGSCAKDGAYLGDLARRAASICREAERLCPRQGPGRRPEIPDWVMAALIVVAVLKQRKSKSSQYRFLAAHRDELLSDMGSDRFPSRSTYFDRYHRAWQLYEIAICLAGRQAIEDGTVAARCVAVDKSVVNARGPRGSQWRRRRKGVDAQAAWTFSKHSGWRFGYAYEVVVTAEKTGPVWPLAASVGPANWQPARTFPEKIEQLPPSTRYIVADAGYDSNDLADAVEYDRHQQRTRRRLLCPYPRHRRGTTVQPHNETPQRRQRRERRRERAQFLKRPFTQRLLRRRGVCVEPFNDWFKTRFDLHERAWHRGLNNNRTQLLAALFAYQLLLAFNHAHGKHNAQLQWIIDAL
jgi:hypothetical protein